MAHPAFLAMLVWAAGAGAQPLTVEVQGIARRADVHAPAASASRPLIIALHGLRQPVTRLREDLGLDAIADRDGFVVAYPEGIEQRWNYGRQLVAPIESDDVAFLRALIARLVGSHRVDARRVYLIGVSNGGLMAYRVACEMGAEFAAVAAFISPMSDLQQEDCPSGRSVPLLILAGNAD